MRNTSESDAGNALETGAHVELCHVVLADLNTVCGFGLLILSYTASPSFSTDRSSTLKPGPRWQKRDSLLVIYSIVFIFLKQSGHSQLNKSFIVSAMTVTLIYYHKLLNMTS